MKTISLVSSKGGVGKSTLAACLATYAASIGESIYLADIDPQQSTASWWRRRKMPENPQLAHHVRTVMDAKHRIAQQNAWRDFLIVDTPGSLVPTIEEAIIEADAVIVVVQASGKDIEAQGTTERLLSKIGKPALYVLNRCDRRSSLPFQAAAKLSGRSAYPPMMIGDRVDYVRADMLGNTAPEMNVDARDEIAALWVAIKGIADPKGRTDVAEDGKRIRNADGKPGHPGNETARRKRSQGGRSQAPEEAE